MIINNLIYPFVFFDQKRLCDPKTSQAVKQIREKFKEKCEEEANKIEISNNTNVNGGKTRPKNLVKWIMEEFEDKNLDKVKRTLLVTLDDISKGNSN
jgi:hypothetical protein